MYLYFMKLLYKIWSPHMWFSLTTLTFSYPNNPSEEYKKQYYSLIHNLPVFYPYDNFDEKFTTILDLYPVSPYLDSKKSFIKWINFVRNKTNQLYQLPSQRESEYLIDYYDNYNDKSELKRKLNMKRYYTVTTVLILAVMYFTSK